jgi:hypothetical protein
MSIAYNPFIYFYADIWFPKTNVLSKDVYLIYIVVFK